MPIANRRQHPPAEFHKSTRAAWLRAAVLGADDGITSTAALMAGVAAARATPSAVIAAGLAGMVGGSLSMAAGEYVSVASQRDAERADLAKEMEELERFPQEELHELTQIYIGRGLDPDLAAEVAQQLTERDALGAHLRDELALDPNELARPVQAASISAGAFAVGAAVPFVTALLFREKVWLLIAVAVFALGTTGLVGASLGGAHKWRGAFRVVLGGGAAMLLTFIIGKLFHVTA